MNSVKEVSNQRYLLITVVFAVMVTVFVLLRPILLPFAVGMVVAYFLDPAVNGLVSRLKMSRSLASVLALGLFLLVLLPLLILVGWLVFTQMSRFAANLPEYLDSLGAKVNDLLKRLQDYLPATDVNSGDFMLSGNWGASAKSLGSLLSKLAANGIAFVNVLSLLLISPVVAFYMLRDWPAFTAKIINLIPKKYKKNLQNAAAAVNRIISGYIRGQALVCVALGCFYAIGLWLVGLEAGILVGLMAGLISFIPYVGTISGFLAAMILVITQYGTMAKILAVVGVFAIGQFLEGNFLTPKLVGENIGLHPVWVMFALLSGGVLLGLLGMIIAVPAAACIGVLLRYMTERYKSTPVYLEK